MPRTIVGGTWRRSINIGLAPHARVTEIPALNIGDSLTRTTVGSENVRVPLPTVFAMAQPSAREARVIRTSGRAMIRAFVHDGSLPDPVVDAVTLLVSEHASALAFSDPHTALPSADHPYRTRNMVLRWAYFANQRLNELERVQEQQQSPTTVKHLLNSACRDHLDAYFASRPRTREMYRRLVRHVVLSTVLYTSKRTFFAVGRHLYGLSMNDLKTVGGFWIEQEDREDGTKPINLRGYVQPVRKSLEARFPELRFSCDGRANEPQLLVAARAPEADDRSAMRDALMLSASLIPECVPQCSCAHPDSGELWHCLFGADAPGYCRALPNANDEHTRDDYRRHAILCQACGGFDRLKPGSTLRVPALSQVVHV
jgi:hypothetical protein